MPDTRYQVFVSSTFHDLRDERQAVLRALLMINCIPSGMELFPADDAEVWEVIKRVIDDCDYYVLVLGGRYGSLDKTGISYTQKEYEYAHSIGRPVTAFVHRDPEGLPARNYELDPELREKLDHFRALVQSRHTVKEWSTPGELEAAVVVAVQSIIKTRPSSGWVKVSEATSLEEVAELRGKVLSLTGDIEKLAKERPPVIDDIAEGNDVYVVACRMRFRPDRSLPVRERRTEANLTWDEIFAAIGPLLLSEASEPKLSSYLAQWIGNSRFGVADRAGMTIHVDADAFETIKVQLLSLGLIEASARKHAIQDTDAYWALTPSGRTRLLQWRAVRKPSSRPVERETPNLPVAVADPGVEPQPAASLSDPPAND